MDVNNVDLKIVFLTKDYGANLILIIVFFKIVLSWASPQPRSPPSHSRSRACVSKP